MEDIVNKWSQRMENENFSLESDLSCVMCVETSQKYFSSYL